MIQPTNPAARKLRKNPTDAERHLWRHIRLRQLDGWKFRRQHPIGNYIADFFCLEKRLIVEVDGGQHVENVLDEERTKFLERRGYRILRFWNNDVLKKTEAVLQKIMEALDTPPAPSPKEGGEMRLLRGLDTPPESPSQSCGDGKLARGLCRPPLKREERKDREYRE